MAKEQLARRDPPGVTPVDRVCDWVVRQGLDGAEIPKLLPGLFNRIDQEVLPIARAFVAFNTLHPLYRGFTFVWHRQGEELKAETLLRHQEAGADYENSPMRHVIKHQLPFFRQRLTGPADPEFPIYRSLRAEGGTDYAIWVVPFRQAARQDTLAQGMVLSLVTDRPGGFSDADLAAMNRLMPPFALTIRARSMYQTAVSVLETYLGPNAGKHVLDGEVDRGAVRTIRAVILFSDLRGFTRMSEDRPGTEMVALLDEYLECMAAPVQAHDGEVLKFLGDGLLAVFEIGEDEAMTACKSALAAARDAMHNVARMNRERARQGLPTMELDQALHVGDVLYGNVGARGRLDFTIIGPAVNEASRIEGQCRILNQGLLISRDFYDSADLCRDVLVSLGRHRLRDISGPRELFTVNAELLEARLA